MDKIVYLIGTGATMAEMQHQSVEGYLNLKMTEIEKNILKMSKAINGKYKELYDRLTFTPELDIELVISLLEGCTFSESNRFKEICVELRKLFRIYLISQITEQNVEAKIFSSLLHIHKEYGHYMGKNGEELLGSLVINYDSLLEGAYQTVYGGINLGYSFQSDSYSSNISLPPLLKLHGSFNWKVKEGALEVSKSFENKDYEDDFLGWIPPSVYKKPQGIYERIWNKAAELLNECSTLRVIGSSLRTEDFVLLSLIFTSQIKRERIFNIELIVNDEEATGSDEKIVGIIQRLSFLGGLINFSNLDVFPKDFVSKGNVFKEWLEMKINEIQGNKGASLSSDAFLDERLWKEI